ncbi:MAG: hydrogenase iron-sulfur subunit [Methanomassiliicoccales archaeon]|nr:hydrogenase iron-sulfur subunit [Methanomassiliicoccales archaeon]
MKIIGYVCSHAGYAAADLAGEERLQYSPDIILIRLPCAGRIDVVHLLKAFREGADMLFVAGCLEGNCHHHYGNHEARKRVDQAKSILDALGMDGRRIEMFYLASNQGWKFKEIADEMMRRASELGSNPLEAKG